MTPLPSALRVSLVLVLGAASCGGGGSASGAGGSAASGGGASPTTAGSGAGGAGGASTTTASTSSTTGDATSSTGSGGPGDPPFGGSSGGAGGPAPVDGTTQQAGGVTYRLIVPASYKAGVPTPFLLVYSGTEGGSVMTQNLTGAGPSTKTSGFLRAVLDGVQYNGDGGAGVKVLDDVRAKYDVDNNRTYLLGESAGTSAAEQLGFTLRQSFFAAYWANDVNQAATPSGDAASLGFQPWGQVGPGGQQAIAQQIVAGMKGADYRLPNPAPYAGPGAGTHGDPQQFLAALSWFPGKSRK